MYIRVKFCGHKQITLNVTSVFSETISVGGALSLRYNEVYGNSGKQRALSV